jgi:hypothetical protein
MAPPENVEILLRLINAELSMVATAYISGSAPSNEEALRWHAGIQERRGSLAPDERDVPGMPGVLIYLRAE